MIIEDVGQFNDFQYFFFRLTVIVDTNS